jgi:hypothetical protein
MFHHRKSWILSFLCEVEADVQEVEQLGTRKKQAHLMLCYSENQSQGFSQSSIVSGMNLGNTIWRQSSFPWPLFILLITNHAMQHYPFPAM